MNGHADHSKPAAATVSPRLFDKTASYDLEAFKQLCTQTTSPDIYKLASSIEENVPIYDLSSHSSTPSTISALQDEWHHILLHGPGIFVVRNLYTSRSLLQTINSTFSQIITSESQSPTTKGDHFSPSHTNSRIWNSLSKHALLSPSTFASYYSNPWLAHICASWLGPRYRITAQVNIVHPGGAPQVSHRDYHIGFQSSHAALQFPREVHALTQHLTLQGAIAHTDMPLESGPTRVLPFSQNFSAGYLAVRDPAFNAFFLENWVSVPLKMGDGMFFNPGLHHAAGQNQTRDFLRSANLLQISSAFGKPMETIDTLVLVEKIWYELSAMFKSEGMSSRVEALIAVIAEGYPFPTNLDRQVPSSSGMAPKSEADVLYAALSTGAGKEEVLAEIEKLQEDSKA